MKDVNNNNILVRNIDNQAFFMYDYNNECWRYL